MSTPDEFADRYIALWNEPDADRRATLLRMQWSADARYTDPLATAEGPDRIAALVEGVRARFPGFHFRRLGAADGHGPYLRFSWTLGPDDQPDMIQGTDFATLDGDRLRSVVGFLDRVPPGAA